MAVHIRSARPDDLEHLPAIERASGEMFRDLAALAYVADDAPTSVEELARLRHEGGVWVAVTDRDEPIGFVVAALLDDGAQVELVCVHPEHARLGIGARLLDAVDGWAAGHGLAALTLTTFRDVAWNAPYYQRLGFRELAREEITPSLAAVLAAEAAHGHDPARRVCMRRPIG